MTFSQDYPELTAGQRAMLLRQLLVTIGEDEASGNVAIYPTYFRNQFRAELRASLTKFIEGDT